MSSTRQDSIKMVLRCHFNQGFHCTVMRGGRWWLFSSKFTRYMFLPAPTMNSLCIWQQKMLSFPRESHSWADNRISGRMNTKERAKDREPGRFLNSSQCKLELDMWVSLLKGIPKTQPFPLEAKPPPQGDWEPVFIYSIPPGSAPTEAWAVVDPILQIQPSSWAGPSAAPVSPWL